ncbi:MAG: DNA mismatch repair protein MutS [Armatimonadetes bacterium]|nr:DNA mismatch repair protein MutS [Armatimonadota bacterium]
MQTEDYRPNTPLMSQYFEAKAQRPDVLLMMRVGDFYEAYGEDAVIVSKELEIALTGRDDGGNRVSMAGVPHHAVERYLARLIAKGFRVALMDQVENPKLAKGLVKRRVTRVLSPGTVLEDSMLDARTNNYLVAAVVEDPVAGLSVADITTGEFLATEMSGDNRQEALIEEIRRLDPAECLISDTQMELAEDIRRSCGVPVTLFRGQDDLRNPQSARNRLLHHFQTQSLRGFGCEEYSAGIEAAALVLNYLAETQESALPHIRTLSTYSTCSFMFLDATARRNLEITAPLGEGSRHNTVRGVLDHTLTSMGGRTLKRWLEEPLLEVSRIEERLGAVAELTSNSLMRGDVREVLAGINDMERLLSRSAAGLASPRDLTGLRDSLERLPRLVNTLGAAEHEGLAALRTLFVGGHPPHRQGAIPSLVMEDLDQSPLQQLAGHLHAALNDDPPALLHEGGVFRDGYHPELDRLRQNGREGKRWIAGLESEERAKTGIGSLKVGYSSVFGYYLEVSKSNIEKVPPHYIRKQTTVNGERYITPDLKEMEATVLGAQDKAIDLEVSLFGELLERVVRESNEIKAVARAVAELDVLASLAESAVAHHYTRPVVDDSGVIEIKAGRHPVVELMYGGQNFVPNDCRLDGENQRIHIITGPNMSGKSTCLRQTAIIVLMAQIGSFVPADYARIGVVDRIFTRAGAHDELASGQSTFMVEMNETANILNNATPRSLVILDEIGRGTSTYDGLSIAWAVVEYLARIGCKALFATHYHHLNELASRIPGICNYRIAVKEQGDQIIWLHKLVPGGTDRSYGIQVARMAGVPPEVIERARQILQGLERNGRSMKGEPALKNGDIPTQQRRLQLTLFEAELHPAIEALRSLDLTEMTPIEAMIRLDEIQRLAKQN